MKSRLGPRLVVHMYFFEFRKLLQYYWCDIRTTLTYKYYI